MFRFMPLALLGLVTLAGSNCVFSFNPGGIACTALYAYGVNASVTNASTGAPIGNATLTLKDGDYEEVMQPFPTGDYVGAGERKGTYTLTAEAPGFESKTIENIVVTADECHVQGVHVDVALQPSP
jgi:Carboxypeptidase regulatory-like domain